MTPVEPSCKFNDGNTAAKDLKEKCFKSDTPGSFGDCSGALKKAAGKIQKCGFGVGTTDGAGTSTKSARKPQKISLPQVWRGLKYLAMQWMYRTTLHNAQNPGDGKE